MLEKIDGKIFVTHFFENSPNIRDVSEKYSEYMRSISKSWGIFWYIKNIIWTLFLENFTYETKIDKNFFLVCDSKTFFPYVWRNICFLLFDSQDISTQPYAILKKKISFSWHTFFGLNVVDYGFFYSIVHCLSIYRVFQKKRTPLDLAIYAF
jgi:hypothetical protein